MKICVSTADLILWGVVIAWAFVVGGVGILRNGRPLACWLFHPEYLDVTQIGDKRRRHRCPECQREWLEVV